MRATPWIPVTPELAAKLSELMTKASLHGRDVIVRISPLDVPQAFRGVVDADSRTVRFEFQYGDQEPGKQRYVGRGLAVETGLYTAKLLAVVISDGSVPRAVELASLAVEGVRSPMTAPSAELNYRAVGDVLRHHRNDPQLQVLTAAH